MIYILKKKEKKKGQTPLFLVVFKALVLILFLCIFMDCQKEAFPGGEGGVEMGCGAGLELLLAPCVVCAGGGGGAAAGVLSASVVLGFFVQ